MLCAVWMAANTFFFYDDVTHRYTLLWIVSKFSFFYGILLPLLQKLNTHSAALVSHVKDDNGKHIKRI